MTTETIKFGSTRHLLGSIVRLLKMLSVHLPCRLNLLPHARPILRSGLIAISCVAMMPLVCLADDGGIGRARFSWEAVADPVVSGYKIHWGTTSGLYTHSADAGNATEVIVTSFTEGVTYFAAVSAYGSGGEESDYSDEYSFRYTQDSPDLGLPGADPDGDGITNLMEYALNGGDPATPNCDIMPVSTLMTIDNQEYLTLTVAKNPSANGLNYAVEVSGNLLSWNSGSEHTVLVSETAETLVVRDFMPLDGSANRFLRLRVTSLSP